MALMCSGSFANKFAPSALKMGLRYINSVSKIKHGFSLPSTE